MVSVHAEKLVLIEWLIRLQDAYVLEKIKNLKVQSEIVAYENSLKPMSSAELTARAEASDKAIEEGRFSNIESILNENW